MALPAIGPMSLMTRRGGLSPLMLAHQSPPPNGPLSLWRDVTGSIFLYTAVNWGAVTWYLEIVARATSAKALFRLYDVTAGAAVSNSVITLNAGSTGVLALPTRNRSSALTLSDGHEYRAQFGVQDGGAGAVISAKLIVV